jgi:drug/metabolite transporter (DMT)-like permease
VTPLAFSLVLLSAVLHAAWSVSIKGSRDPLLFNVLQLAAPFAATLAMLPTIPLGELPPRVFALLAATAVCHTGYFWWLTRALEHGDLTLVYPIARSTPAFLPLLAVPLLGEELSPGGLLGIATVVAGLWLVQAGSGGLRLASFASPAARYAYLTLAATVGYGLVDKLAMAELAAAPWPCPVPRSAFWVLMLSSTSSLLFLPLALRARGARAIAAAARADLATPSLAAGVSLLGYALILKALETAPASYVVAVRQTSVLFALALGVMRLREEPGRARVAGAAATVAGVALIALYGRS